MDSEYEAILAAGAGIGAWIGGAGAGAGVTAGGAGATGGLTAAGSAATIAGGVGAGAGAGAGLSASAIASGALLAGGLGVGLYSALRKMPGIPDLQKSEKDTAAQRAAYEAAQRKLKRQQTASSWLTGPLGITTPPTTVKTELGA